LHIYIHDIQDILANLQKDEKDPYHKENKKRKEKEIKKKKEILRLGKIIN